MEFSDNIGYLKRFLTLRDTNPIFDEVKENHWVGVPCFQFQDGSLSLDIDEVVKRAEEEVLINPHFPLNNKRCQLKKERKACLF